jgi:hypothetical protein
LGIAWSLGLWELGFTRVRSFQHQSGLRNSAHLSNFLPVQNG